MKTNKFLITSLLLISSVYLFSQEWISLDSSNVVRKPLVEIVSSNSQELVFSVKIFGFYKDLVNIDNSIYAHIHIPDCQSLGEVGKPALPIITELIEVPSESDLRITIIDSTCNQLLGYHIYPYQTPLLETETNATFEKDNEFYSSSVTYPSQNYYYSELMNWRGVHNRNLILCPFKYQPQEQILKVLSEFKIRVEFNGIINSKNAHNSKYIKAFKEHILNYNGEEISDNLDKGNEKGKITLCYDYLIIASPTYFNSVPLRELRDWKSRVGIKCKMVSTATTGTTATEIKDYISNEYTKRGIGYVLFVGDHTDIPLYNWNNWDSDYWYGCVDPGTSSDYQAEIAIGRFSVSSLSELENMVNKTINYEKRPPISNWVEKSLLIAHKENAPDKYQNCKEQIHNTTYSITTPIFDIAYGAHAAQGGNDATNQTIINALNDGRGLVNYRGHGSETGWISSWSYQNNAFDSEEINSLTSTTKTPIIFSVACSNGAIYATNTCMLENFTRGTNGAVAFLGATKPSYTTVNHTFDKELYSHIYNNGVYNIGDVLVQSNIQTMTNHSNNSSSICNAKIYLWGGDPSLEIWTATPSMFTNVTISDNGTSVSVNTGGVSDCSIIICSTLDDGASFFNIAEGVSNYTFSSVARPYYVTVKKHNFIPYISDTYLQNKNISSDAFISGKNIYAGENVKPIAPQGEVIIEDGTNIIIDADEDVHIEGGFEIETTGSMEIR